MWVVRSSLANIILFFFNTSRSQEASWDIFEGYKGYLQIDGYDGYNKIFNNGATRVGCNAHARRKFATLIKISSGNKIGTRGIKFFEELYKIEHNIANSPPEEKYKIRQQQAIPMWEKFEQWALSVQNKLAPSSMAYRSLQYFFNELPYLKTYLTDGMMSTNHVWPKPPNLS